MLIAILVAGCGNSGNNSSRAEEGNSSSSNIANDEGMDPSSEKLTLTFMPESWSGGKWREDHPTIQYLNEKFNIDLQVMWTDGPTYKEKLNVLAASSDLPDMYAVTSDNFGKWQNEGIFLDLAPYLDEYPNLKNAFPQDQWEMLNPQGKILGIPRWELQNRDSYQIRADWLDKLGIAMPDEDTFDVDQFYEIMRAFALDDPDGNGKKDTVGFTTDNRLVTNTDQLRAAFGLANQWKMVDGELIPEYVQSDEQKAFLGYLRKMYEEGVLDQDFLSKQNANVYETFQSGRSGLFSHHSRGIITDELKLRESTPEARLVQLAPPIGPDGLRGNPTSLIGANKIVINNKIDKKKQERILEILDWWVTDEGTDIMKSGIEGIHYQVEADGTVSMTDLTESDLPRIMNNWFFKRADPNLNIFKWTDPEEAAFDAAYNENNAKYPWFNESGGLEIFSETYAKEWNNLSTKFKEAQLKIVIGQEPIEYIDQAIQEWRAGGGDQIIEEMNTAYASLKNE